MLEVWDVEVEDYNFYLHIRVIPGWEISIGDGGGGPLIFVGVMYALWLAMVVIKISFGWVFE